MLIVLSRTISVDHDDCDPNPCQNGATCQNLINDYKCTCIEGWEGKTCTEGKKESLQQLFPFRSV